MCRTPAPSATAVGGPPHAHAVEVADIFRAAGEAFRLAHPLSRCQLRAMRAIEACRTAALGGRTESCDHCGAVRILYNSCRNRHCPKCQSAERERWLLARQRDLLPIPYFHVVFTLPHDLNSLAQGNPRLVYKFLFDAAAATLRAFGKDPRHLGGEIGITAVLHTWGRNLSQHVHLHCIVTGGALSADGSRWIPARKNFLFPVRAMSRVFRGKFLALLEEAFQAGRLRFQGSTGAVAQPAAFTAWLATLRRQDWVVYCKRPLAGPQAVLGYLARYTHRVAISNERLVGFSGGIVRFRWKDHADAGRVKILALPAEEFIRRFLLHILPDHFVRIRHFGLLASRCREAKLQRCRSLLGLPPLPPPPPEEPTSEMMSRLTGTDLGVCPVCRQGRMHLTEILLPTGTHRPGPSAPDTS
jgi:hypothetical protein